MSRFYQVGRRLGFSMDFGFTEVFPSSAVNDVVFVPSFYDIYDCLVLAKGNRLIVYVIDGEYVTEPKSFEVFGVIERLIPVRYSHAGKSNLLIILTDLNACIVRTDDDNPNTLISEKVGTLQSSWDSEKIPIRYAIHPTCIIIQYQNFSLDVFPIQSDCTLGESFKITTGHKKIISFQFIGPTSKVTRLVVLTDEYSQVNNTGKTQQTHRYDIDLTNMTYQESPAFHVVLDDSYFMIPYDLDNHSMVVVFSSQQATRVIFEELEPVVKTATLLTVDRLIKVIALSNSFHLAINSSNVLYCTNIEKEGQIILRKLGTVPHPSEFVPINSHLAFVASKTNDSQFIIINHENYSYSSSVIDTIRSTGQILAFRSIKNELFSIYQRAIVHSHISCNFSSNIQIELELFNKIFVFYFEQRELQCYLLSNSDLTLVMGNNMDGELIDISDVFESSLPTLAFYQLGPNTFLHITNKSIRLYDFDHSENDNPITIDDIGIINVSRSDNLISVLSSKDRIFFYEIIGTPDEINEEESMEKAEEEEKHEQNNTVETEDDMAIIHTEDDTTTVHTEDDTTTVHTEDDTTTVHTEDEDVINHVEVEKPKQQETIPLPIIKPRQKVTYEVRKMNHTIYTKQNVFAISLMKSFLAAVSINPNRVYIYNIQNDTHHLIRTIDIGPIVDIASFSGRFYALSPTDRVTVIQPNLSSMKFIECKGRHTSLTVLKDKSIVVCGPNPAMITHNDQICVLNLNSRNKPIFSVSSNDEETVVLNNEGLFIGQFNQQQFENISYYSETPIIDLFEFNNNLIAVRANSNKEIVFYTTNQDRIFESEDTDSIFGGLKKNEQYVGYFIYRNSIIIASNNRILTFSLDGTKIKMANSIKSPKPIYQIGQFRDYLYIQYIDFIQIFYPSTFTSGKIKDSSALMMPLLAFSCNGRIEHASFGNLICAFVHSKQLISIYTFHDYNEQLIQIDQPYRHNETITSVSILHENVLFGTENGNIYRLDFSLNSANQYEISIKEGFNIGEEVVNMTNINNNSEIMAAGISGISFRINKAIRHPKFFDLYRILAQKLTSIEGKTIGKFRKDFQRAPKSGRFLPSLNQMCDMDLVNSFASLSREVKIQLLHESSISLELADEIINYQ